MLHQQTIRHTKLHTVTYLFLSTIISCTCNKQTPSHEVRDTVQTEVSTKREDSIAIFNNNVDSWLENKLQKRVDWNKLRQEEMWRDDSVKTEVYMPDDNFYKDYSSVLRWSPDSSYVLDIGSYGSVLVEDDEGNLRVEAGEPDTEISLLNPKQNQRTVLFFVGPSSSIFDATWIDKSIALVLGSFDEQNKGQPDTLFWLINVKTNLYRMYKFK